MATVIKCGTCGSTGVEFDAVVYWDSELEKFVATDISETANCFAMGGCGRYQPYITEVDGVVTER